MGKIFYYCYNAHCRRVSNNKTFRCPTAELGQELDNKKLCPDCYNYGFRLERGIVVVKRAIK